MRSATDAWLDLVWRRHRLVLGVAALVTLACALLATRLELRTNVAELLPSKDPAVEELQYMSKRIGGTSILQIAIESPDRDANLRLAGALEAELVKLPPDTIESAVYDVRAERKFFLSRKWLYAPLSELEALRDSLRSEIRKKKNPLYVDLLDEDSPKEIVERMRKRADGFDPFPTGYFEGDHGRIVVIVCRPPGGLFAERAGEKLAKAAERIIRDAHPERYHPKMQVGLTGDVMSQLEERHALESDLVMATAVCVTLVCLVVIVFYGRFRAIPFVGIPALMGVAFAFGMAELLFGYLNASTAFMGSIVVGNGINFPIIQLARYEEERRGNKSPRESASIALAATIRGTAVAAFGAAVAYASLMVTRFRGFSQFGTIGGLGMVATWLATVTVLPALWAAFDKRERTARRFAPPVTAFSDLVARLATQAPKSCLIVFGLLTVVSIVPLKRYLHDPFEYDFRNLRNRRSLESGAALLAERVDPIFGKTLTPAVIIADRRAHTGEIRKKVLERDKSLPGPQLIGQVTTLDDFLPGDAATQRKKLAVLRELDEIIDSPAAQFADDDVRADLKKLRPPDDLAAVGDGDLPIEVKRPFVESDGTVGRVLLVYHDEHVSVWDGRNLMRIADIIGEIALDDGTVVRSSGHAVIFAAMIRSIVHDAPLATGASLLAVSLLVIALARSRAGAALVVGFLVAGVLWMLGTAAWVGVRTNFLNFIALPITFGIGVDYGINIYLRYRLEGRGRVGRAVRATGGAVALCSLTTIIGYAALLVADNQALRSFGEMAILGEVACLSAAVVGMPAFLVWRERRARLERPHMTRIVPASDAVIAEAAALLQSGELVAFPTETVYGLGGLARSEASLAKIFAAKGRPATHPLIAHVRSPAEAATLTTGWDARAQALAERFWPGPLTLVVPRAPSLPATLSGGKPTVALRSPAHPVAQALLAAVGAPLAAPSANKYQTLSPTTAAHVARAFGAEVALVLDGGPCAAGLESTVLDLTVTPPAVLRPGALPLAALRALVPDVALAAAVVADEAARRSPGQDAIHYAPRAQLLLCDRTIALARRDAALVLRGAGDPSRPDAVVLPDDAAAYGRALYATLHALDDAGARVIAVESPPDDEAWLAVADRLRRAAAK